jgi:ubiquinone/menaquinone biosynthesis C-methylase UbiE
MTRESKHDAWSAGQNYEQYMGRWSREIAHEFVAWLDQPADLDWLDIGCGTGALAATILERCAPRSVLGVDPSDGFVEHAHSATPDARARFAVGEAGALPCADGSIDVVTSALAYNYFPDRPAALAEMQRVARPGSTVSFYVWDYPGGGMGFIDAFWNAAVATGANAEAHVASRRFPFCTPEALLGEMRGAGLADADIRAIELTARFEDFEDFWRPFTLGAGPAPGYYLSLDEAGRHALRQKLNSELGGGGRIEFPARAWAVRVRAG